MRIIVFDLCGTLMEYEGPPCSWIDHYEQGIKEIDRRYHCNVSPADIAKSVDTLKSYDPEVCYREAEYDLESIFAKALEHWNADINIRECAHMFYENLQMKTRIYPDTAPVLNKLKSRQYQIAALADLPAAMPNEIFRRSIRELLGYFDLYVSSASCGFRKPNQAGLWQIAEHFNVPISELIFVGDKEKDRLAAQKAGYLFVYMNRKEKAGKGISDLYELLEILD